MKIVKEQNILRATIEYDNSKGSDERNQVFDLLDGRYGYRKYNIVGEENQPPKDGEYGMSVGQIIIEVVMK